jgi:hypothetical protein
MKNILLGFILLLVASLSFASIEDLRKDTKGLNKLFEQIKQSGDKFDTQLTDMGEYKIKRIGKKFVAVFYSAK